MSVRKKGTAARRRLQVGDKSMNTTVSRCTTQSIGIYLRYVFVSRSLSLSLDNQVYKVTQCESGWFPLQGYCYNLYGTLMTERKQYADAQEVCEKNGAQLASIHSVEDMHMLTTHFTGSRH